MMIPSCWHSGASALNILSKFKLIFWDFDGVIKESVDIKSQAYQQLFQHFGTEFTKRVLEHHETYGGVSRFTKIPLYLKWAGVEPSANIVNEYCERFSSIVTGAVIGAPYVPGVFDYIRARYRDQHFVLLTATPKEEIDYILASLDLLHFFREVYGAPICKGDIIESVMKKHNLRPDCVLMVGDSETDFRAAESNAIAFLLRRTPINVGLQSYYTGPTFDDLRYE